MMMFSAMGFGITAVVLFVLGFVLPLMSLVKGCKRKQVLPCVCGAMGLFFSFFFLGLFPVALILGIIGLVQSGKLPVSETWPKYHAPESEPEQYSQDTAQYSPQQKPVTVVSEPVAKQDSKPVENTAAAVGPKDWDSLKGFMDTEHMLEFRLTSGEVIRGFVGAVDRKALVIRLETGKRQYVEREELVSFRKV